MPRRGGAKRPQAPTRTKTRTPGAAAAPRVRVKLRPSSLVTKKREVKFLSGPDRGRVVRFGQAGAPDFTTHRDPKRAYNYLQRHGGDLGSLRRDGVTKAAQLLKVDRTTAKSRERWDDMKTAGFWSRWLLWSHPNLQKAQSYIAKRFGVEWVL